MTDIHFGCKIGIKGLDFMTNILPEILSPVGSAETLEVAVRSGADAVYLGCKDFSARRNAENFNIDELKDVISYCHIRGVKVYLALNIMLKQSEIGKALNIASKAYTFGIDGIIVEDLGFAGLLHKTIKDLPLHASTQMSVHSPSALYILKKIGFSRVVAAREMNKEQLKEFCKIAKSLDMEVEVFVHGALCMSVSGQCLLSAVLGARSGNRGLCAGPCRLPFSAPNGTGYDLSLKDLSLYNYVNELKDMGVSSLKIEGRMKRPEYVAVSTSVFRRAVDNGTVPTELLDLLKDVFSRSGFTDGYYTANLGQDMFGIRTKDDVISSKDTFSSLHDLYRNERQSVGIDISATFKSGERASITVSDGVNTVTVSGEVPSLAKSKSADCETVKSSLCKLGGTPYYAKNTVLSLDDGLFIPSSVINGLRREAVEKLSQKRCFLEEKNIFKPEFSKNDIKHNEKPEFYIRVNDFSLLPTDLSGISTVIIPIEANIPDRLPENVTFAVELPRYIDNEQNLNKRLFYAKEKNIKKAYCGNLSAVESAQKAGFEIIGGIGLNVCNSESIDVFSKLGVDEITLSAEISAVDAVNLNSAIRKGIFAYGRLPLMLLKNCPLKNGRECKECDKNGYITDRKGIQFPIRCRYGYSELLNSKPLYIADRLNEFQGLDFMLLYFTAQTKEEIIKTINDYKNGAQPPKDYTRGLYYRTTV